MMGPIRPRCRRNCQPLLFTIIPRLAQSYLDTVGLDGNEAAPQLEKKSNRETGIGSSHVCSEEDIVESEAGMLSECGLSGGVEGGSEKTRVSVRDWGGRKIM
jgi:hypothetical protein